MKNVIIFLIAFPLIFISCMNKGEENRISLQGNTYAGSYRELFSDESISFAEAAQIVLTAWDYRVFVGEN